MIRGLFEVGSVRWGSHTTGTHLHSRVGGRGTRERERESISEREGERKGGVLGRAEVGGACVRDTHCVCLVGKECKSRVGGVRYVV